MKRTIAIWVVGLGLLIGFQSANAGRDSQGPWDSILDAIASLQSTLAEQMAGLEASIASLGGLSGDVSNLDGKLDGLASDHHDLSKQVAATGQSLSADIGSLTSDHTALSSGHQSLADQQDSIKDELLAAIAAQGGMPTGSSAIEETTSVVWFGPEINQWNPQDGYNPEVSTISLGAAPKRVNLWIYGTHEGERWEKYNGTNGTRDSFTVAIIVNGRILERINVNSETREGYLSHAFNPVKDFTLSGEVSIEFRRTLSDPSQDTDPFVISWYVEG